MAMMNDNLMNFLLQNLAQRPMAPLQQNYNPSAGGGSFSGGMAQGSGGVAQGKPGKGGATQPQATPLASLPASDNNAAVMPTQTPFTPLQRLPGSQFNDSYKPGVGGPTAQVATTIGNMVAPNTMALIGQAKAGKGG